MEEGRLVQIRGAIERQKEAIRSMKTDDEKSIGFGLWGGSLGGFWLTGAITREEYLCLYAEMEIFEKTERGGEKCLIKTKIMKH